MGFFSLHETCAVCGTDTGFDKRKLANKEYICMECFSKLTACKKNVQPWFIASDEVRSILSSAESNEKKAQEFSPTSKVGLLKIDENNLKWMINKKVFGFSEIVEYELLEDGSSVTKGGLGRAVVGGVLLGGVGAVVGGVTGKKKSKSVCDSLKLKITINRMNNPVEYIDFIVRPTQKNSLIYKQKFELAQECLSALQIICSSKDVEVQSFERKQSSADEILKFKQLLDAGAITQIEYDEKKKHLLSIY